MQKNRADVFANDLLRKYKLGRPTLDNLVFIAEDLGYEIIDYDRAANSTSVNHIVENYNLEHLIAQNDAFLFSNSHERLIFLYSELSTSDKEYALAHEIGHIVCGHLRVDTVEGRTLTEEREANEFAHTIFNPSIRTRATAWLFANKRVAILVAAMLCLAIAAIPIVHAMEASKYHDYYYVTDSGEKYHLKDCYFLQGHDSHRMTEAEWQSGKYTPCKVCIR